MIFCILSKSIEDNALFMRKNQDKGFMMKSVTVDVRLMQLKIAIV